MDSELASNFSAELLLEHVRPHPCLPPDVLTMRGFDVQSFEQQLTEEARQKLEKVSETRVSEQIKKRLISREGDAGHEILETAKNEVVDLIVIATHGMSGWHHYVLGAVAQQVTHHTPCAVLVVRSPLHQK